MKHCGNPTSQKFGSELRHEKRRKHSRKKGVAWHKLCIKGHDLETAEIVT